MIPTYELAPRNYLRVRGEYTPHGAIAIFSMELPPRARRIPVERAQQTVKIGTTSACAENTPRKRTNIRKMRNYLRVRGEYWRPCSIMGSSWELPPRARRIPIQFP